MRADTYLRVAHTTKKITVAASILSLSLFGLLWFKYLYWQMPLSDDVLGQFIHSIDAYIDGRSFSPDNGRILTISDAVNDAVYMYLNWGGRLVPFLFSSLLSLTGKFLTTIVECLVFLGVVLGVASMAFGSVRKALHHPADLSLISALLLWQNGYMGIFQMRTMILQYGLPVLLCTFYISLSIGENGKTMRSGIKEVFLFVFGILAGLTHEICVIATGIFLFVYMLCRIKDGKQRAVFITRRIGFLFGAAICIFSPGNFIRITQSHEATTLNYFQRLNSVIQAHKNNMSFGATLWELLLFALLIILLYNITRNGLKKAVFVFVFDYLEYLSAMVIIPMLWAATKGLNPYGPYGAIILSCFLISFILKHISTFVHSLPTLNNSQLLPLACKVLSSAIAIGISLSLLIGNLPWLNQLQHETSIRKQLIDSAVYSGKSQITVPPYSELVSNAYTMSNLNNIQSYFDTSHYIAYYGTHIKIGQ